MDYWSPLYVHWKHYWSCVVNEKQTLWRPRDRIPQRILKDGNEWLKYPLSFLFDQIYRTKQLPEQWLIAKITPIFKKGNPTHIENYRPISNLCSCSKIFEKLILLRIRKLEAFNNLDLTGKPQHGFKAKHSTTTACMTLQ